MVRHIFRKNCTTLLDCKLHPLRFASSLLVLIMDGPTPPSWARDSYLVFEAEHDSGGHFAAHEKPAELAGDLRKMFGKGGPAYGVVQDRKGY